MRHAVLNADGVVVNLIICAPDFNPGEGFSLVSCEGVFVRAGMKYVNGEFVNPDSQNDPENA